MSDDSIPRAHEFIGNPLQTLIQARVEWGARHIPEADRIEMLKSTRNPIHESIEEIADGIFYLREAGIADDEYADFFFEAAKQLYDIGESVRRVAIATVGRRNRE